MNISIDIKGEGRVDTFEDNGSVILTALPSDSWSFKHFDVDGLLFTANPLKVEDKADSKVILSFYVTIEDYLKGLVGFDVTESALNSIRIYRGIKKGADVEELTTKEKDLAYADLLMWAVTNPSSYTGAKQSDFGWTETEASKTITVTDKKGFRKDAMDIYKRYGDRKYSSKIVIRNLC